MPRVYDNTGNVIETHERTGNFKDGSIDLDKRQTVAAQAIATPVNVATRQFGEQVPKIRLLLVVRPDLLWARK